MKKRRLVRPALKEVGVRFRCNHCAFVADDHHKIGCASCDPAIAKGEGKRARRLMSYEFLIDPALALSEGSPAGLPALKRRTVLIRRRS